MTLSNASMQQHSGNPSSPFSVDEVFAGVVQRAGGLPVSDLLPPRTNLPKNADYVFPNHNVIAELKRLKRDLDEDRELSIRIQELCTSWLAQGKKVPVVYGRAQINLRDLPRECAHQIISLYRKPIHRRIREANQQIRSTKTILQRHDAKGLLILIHDGDYSINPESVLNLVSRCMNGRYFSSIDDFVFANGNMRAIRPGDPLDYKFLYHFHRDPNRAVSSELIERIGIGWRQELERVTGVAMSAVKPPDFVEFIDSLRYAKPRKDG
jgi:hypothetical protein